jgi:hypothetical protein
MLYINVAASLAAGSGRMDCIRVCRVPSAVHCRHEYLFFAQASENMLNTRTQGLNIEVPALRTHAGRSR